jgi:hypothetical protein
MNFCYKLLVAAGKLYDSRNTGLNIEAQSDRSIFAYGVHFQQL